ncbi:unnamed protein product [Mytilus coruscus]|uniref:Uncharacterized protein n=1 Tax=Mytilus coruscus TaxID=42192 RepID=A0A6J8F1R7_MYTCO|nr:unnamed protein product [Mytilus coruscus]
MTIRCPNCKSKQRITYVSSKRLAKIKLTDQHGQNHNIIIFHDELTHYCQSKEIDKPEDELEELILDLNSITLRMSSDATEDNDIQFNVHLPACLLATSIAISTSTPQPSSSPLVLILPPTKTRVSIEEYRNIPARESNPPFFQPLHTSLNNFFQTSGMDVREVYLPLYQTRFKRYRSIFTPCATLWTKWDDRGGSKE